MPYEIAFVTPVTIGARDQYINECCGGGDVVVDALLPAIRKHYSAIETNQEDWGWFIRFRDGNTRLSVDVFTDDPDAGSFRILLTSKQKHLLIFDRVVEGPALETLRVLAVDELTRWSATAIKVSTAD